MVVFLGGCTVRCLHLTRALRSQRGHRIRLMNVMTTTSEQDMSGHGDQGEDGDNLGAHDSLQYGRREGNVLRRTSNIYRANSVPSIIFCSKSSNAVRRKLVGAGHARRLVASNRSHFDGTLVKTTSEAATKFHSPPQNRLFSVLAQQVHHSVRIPPPTT